MIMWVSKKEFEALKDRIERLESRGVNTADRAPDAVIWPGVAIPTGFYQISAAKAVGLIAEHLGIRFRWKDAEKSGAYVEPVKRSKR